MSFVDAAYRQLLVYQDSFRDLTQEGAGDVTARDCTPSPVPLLLSGKGMYRGVLCPKA